MMMRKLAEHRTRKPLLFLENEKKRNFIATIFVKINSVAQLNFSGPWEIVGTLWQYLLLQIYKTLPNLTLLNQFSIPFPVWATFNLALPGSILPLPHTF